MEILEIDIQISHGSLSHLEEGERWTCPQNVQRLPQVQPGQGDSGHPVEWKHSHLAAVSGIWYLASGIWQINHWCPIEALFENSLEQDIAHSQLARLPGRLCAEKFHTFSSIVAFANF